MHPDLHLVRARPPILDVPPLVWIEPPGAPKVHIQSMPLWEWPKPPPPRRLPLVRLGVVIAVVVVALAIALAEEPARLQLPVPGEPIWCACAWWPSGPARTLS